VRYEQPKDIRVIEDASDASVATYRAAGKARPRIVVERRWFTPAHLATAVFCVVWDGFAAFFCLTPPPTADPPLLLRAFPPLWVCLGLVITYGAVSVFVNRTRIVVDDGVLSIVQGPLPWPGNRRVAVEDLRQLFCEMVVGRGSRTYRLNALLTSGASTPLLVRLRDPDAALYLEELLEARLGIAHERVPGEYR
jgi:hypothetical protein